MTRDIFKFLRSYSTDTLTVDRLIVTSYLEINQLSVSKNKFIKRYVISQRDGLERHSLERFKELIVKFNKHLVIENLIELFEFVVSPADKIVNGAVYTPLNIREYIVDQILSSKYQPNQTLTCADISCGCGGFLLTTANWLHKTSQKSLFEIYEQQIFGLDITAYSVKRAKLLLIINAIEKDEEKKEFLFNLRVGNALSFKRDSLFKEVTTGFSVIIGNPPYVCSRNMDAQSKGLLTNWSVAASGHPDLYIPFFQIGAENLQQEGMLGYITVNTFTKSINGRALRAYFSSKQLEIRIINFGGEQLFKDRNTYTCLCFITNSKGRVNYTKTSSKSISQLDQDDFQHFEYDDLDDFHGWNLTKSSDVTSFIRAVERTGTQFKDKFTTRSGIATLKNEIYKFVPFKTDSKYHYFLKDDEQIKVEKAICRDVVNSNKLKSDIDLRKNQERIIFPYYQNDEEVVIIGEGEFRDRYPYAYNYLQQNRKTLGKRDKGKTKYEKWYAYGRRQSMDINAYKLFFPHICEQPSFVLCRDKDLLFYNGMAVISDSLIELQILKRILESDIFLDYITHTTKSYSSGYISLARNYLKNFGICDLSPEQRTTLLNLENQDEINSFLANVYKLKRDVWHDNRALCTVEY